jgi:hypothetical protein
MAGDSADFQIFFGIRGSHEYFVMCLLRG